MAKAALDKKMGQTAKACPVEDILDNLRRLAPVSASPVRYFFFLLSHEIEPTQNAAKPFICECCERYWQSLLHRDLPVGDG